MPIITYSSSAFLFLSLSFLNPISSFPENVQNIIINTGHLKCGKPICAGDVCNQSHKWHRRECRPHLCSVTATKMLHVSDVTSTIDADALVLQWYSWFTRAKKSLNKTFLVSWSRWPQFRFYLWHYLFLDCFYLGMLGLLCRLAQWRKEVTGFGWGKTTGTLQ